MKNRTKKIIGSVAGLGALAVGAKWAIPRMLVARQIGKVSQLAAKRAGVISKVRGLGRPAAGLETEVAKFKSYRRKAKGAMRPLRNQLRKVGRPRGLRGFKRKVNAQTSNQVKRALGNISIGPAWAK